MSTLSPHELARPDATIRYWTGGPVGAPTLVLLHGATLDHRAWAPQTEALLDRFHVVVPDLRAHGRSTGHFDFHAAVDDVLALLERLPAGHVVLVGLSLGGNLAQEAVRRAPDRVHAVVVADATCNAAARHPLAASITATALSAHAMLPGDHFARHAARTIAVDPQVQRYALEVNAHRPNRETVRILSSLLTDALRHEPDYRLPVPALLVHGQLDQIGDITTGTRAWARREPLAEYAVIPGAGHASNLDNPEAFTAALIGFLERVLPQAAVAEPPSGAESAEEPHRRDEREPGTG
ncbi:MAG TPA: alpha/beta hydrolase [Pseudonocardia sp.]|nr:alpha/beta hydrolase [Pseudonocardia sp.]